MAITDKQRAARAKVLGASDIPALMGLVPWKTGEEVRLEKLGRIDPAPTSEAAEIGLLHERAVLDWAESKIGRLVRNPNNVIRTYRPLRVRASLDAAAVDDAYNPVEVKIAGIVNPMFRGEEWGEAGTDEVPERVAVQGQTQLLCTGKAVCHVAALIAGRGHVMFRLERNEAIIAAIMRCAALFWKHVKEDIVWDRGIVSSECLSRIRRVPKSIVAVPEFCVLKWQDAKRAVKVAQEWEEAARAELLGYMGVAEAADYGDPDNALTYFEQHRAGYSVPPTTFRSLRISKRKNVLDCTPINMPQLTQGETDVGCSEATNQSAGSDLAGPTGT